MANNETQEYINFIRKYFYYNDELSWRDIKAKLKKIKPTKQLEYLYCLIHKLDAHATMTKEGEMKASKKASLKSYKKFLPKVGVKDKKLYITMPAFPGWMREKYGSKYVSVVTGALNRAYEKGINQVIIDLRGNYGGASDVMITALMPILPQKEKLFYVYDRDNKLVESQYIDGKYLVLRGDKKKEVIGENKSKFKTFCPKIKIYVDEYTASAGEFVALCFYHMQNVKLIGTPTRGLLTDVTWGYLSDGTHFSFTRGKIYDRFEQLVEDEKVYPTSYTG